MRKIAVLIVLFISVYIMSFGQSYIPLLKSGNEWNDIIHNYPSGWKSGVEDTTKAYLKCGKLTVQETIRTFIYKLSSDSIINDTIYKKLICSYDSSSLVWNFVGLLREDTVTKKVYIRGNNYCNDCEEQLIYNFNLHTGDKFSYIWNKQDTFWTASVVSIDSINIGFEKHKRIKLSNDVIWIEGVGDLNGIIFITIVRPTCASFEEKLLCLYNDKKLIYHPPVANYNDCFYWNTVYYNKIKTVLDVDEFKLFPNPTSDILNIISVNNNIFDIDIFDLQGVKLLEKNKVISNAILELNGIHAGVYTLRISSSQKVSIYRIIIK